MVYLVLCSIPLPANNDMDFARTYNTNNASFEQLRVAVVGGGLGGLSAAIALRRAGHIGTAQSVCFQVVA
jgi:uridine phosphorylase